MLHKDHGKQQSKHTSLLSTKSSISIKVCHFSPLPLNIIPYFIYVLNSIYIYIYDYIFCFCFQVYEDQEEGIVCYKDEKGEIVCEGHDEGPRFSQKDLQTSCYGR